MRIEIDPHSGFCFGVVYAIAQAEFFLDQGIEVYCLGEIVHNDKEVERLKNKGLKIINHDEFRRLKDAIVLIRAHGEPPSTYEYARQNGITLIDASCPVVLKLQNRIREVVKQAAPGSQIVLYGKPGHPEVRGLLGQVPDDAPVKAILITNMNDLDKIDFSRPIYFFSQTTKSLDHFHALAEEIRRRAQDAGNDQVWVNDTICRQVANRYQQIQDFARQYDVVIFVAGKHSSNGRVLFEHAREANPQTYFVSSPEELRPEWFEGAESVGICGATSTPQWLMEQIRDQIRLMEARHATV